MSPPSVMEGLYTRIFKTAPRRVRDPASDDSRFTAAGTLDGHRHAWVALLTFPERGPACLQASDSSSVSMPKHGYTCRRDPGSIRHQSGASAAEAANGPRHPCDVTTPRTP